MPDKKRRSSRYPASLRLWLHLPAGELETTTEEISLEGFSARCTPAPEVATRLGFVLHLPDERRLAGTVVVVRTTPQGDTGFELTLPPAHQQEWEAFLDQERANG